ncbi:Retinol dehydrogenase 13, partial [Stegodyphus mimosarum]
MYTKEERLDVLIHNAGVTPKPGLHLTAENLELQFATNHFGPFLLTHLLIHLMKRSAPSRVIVVSSCTHLWATLDLDNLNCEKYVRDPYWIYCSTKLANILFVHELSKRLIGTGVTVNALHPGGVRTSIAR